MPTVLILGANAGIGRALAAEFASHQYGLILAGRDLEELQALAADLNLRHNVSTRAGRVDVLNFEALESSLAACIGPDGDSLEGIVLCTGYLGNPEAARRIGRKRAGFWIRTSPDPRWLSISWPTILNRSAGGSSAQSLRWQGTAAGRAITSMGPPKVG